MVIARRLMAASHLATAALSLYFPTDENFRWTEGTMQQAAAPAASGSALLLTRNAQIIGTRYYAPVAGVEIIARLWEGTVQRAVSNTVICDLGYNEILFTTPYNAMANIEYVVAVHQQVGTHSYHVVTTEWSTPPDPTVGPATAVGIDAPGRYGSSYTAAPDLTSQSFRRIDAIINDISVPVTPPDNTAMPLTSPAGWTRILSEDFMTPSAVGTFTTATPSTWRLATTNPYYRKLRVMQNGIYTTQQRSVDYPTKTIDVVASAYGANGVIRVRGYSDTSVTGYYRTVNGEQVPLYSLAGEIWPVLDYDNPNNLAQTGQIYGRYQARFRTAGGPGYGTAFLLWPSSDTWAEGEIDYPEMGWGGTIQGYVHKIGDPAINAARIASTATTDDGWHISTVEWYPDALAFYLDGELLKVVYQNVPSTRFRWGWQSGGHGSTPSESSDGYMMIDWITVDAYNGATSPPPPPPPVLAKYYFPTGTGQDENFRWTAGSNIQSVAAPASSGSAFKITSNVKVTGARYFAPVAGVSVMSKIWQGTTELATSGNFTCAAGYNEIPFITVPDLVVGTEYVVSIHQASGTHSYQVITNEWAVAPTAQQGAVTAAGIASPGRYGTSTTNVPASTSTSFRRIDAIVETA